MKKYTKYILSVLLSSILITGIVYGATITTFTQSIVAGDSIDTAWYNAVNTKLKGTYTSAKMCTADASGTIQCINTIPSTTITCNCGTCWATKELAVVDVGLSSGCGMHKHYPVQMCTPAGWVTTGYRFIPADLNTCVW